MSDINNTATVIAENLTDKQITDDIYRKRSEYRSRAGHSPNMVIMSPGTYYRVRQLEECPSYGHIREDLSVYPQLMGCRIAILENNTIKESEKYYLEFVYVAE